MSPARRAVAVATWSVASALLALLLVTTWGVASEYGSGAGDLAAFAVLPLVVAVVAAGLGSSPRTSMAVLAGFVAVTVAGLVVSGELGQRDRVARLAAQDATFTCNGPSAEGTVPGDVDAAFHVPAHPGGYWLYGPVSSSRFGCTAAIHGPADASFAAWRASLLATGWEVARDDTEVVVRKGGVRLTLYVQGGLSMLNTTDDGAGACEDGRSASYATGQVGAC
ncbi:hypothetical protein [Nocardioides sp.]|uniref:hypothetical protein n=1 Tax=Nocardioides sp. TaxID=35761 RepID=UPI0035AF3246